MVWYTHRSLRKSKYGDSFASKTSADVIYQTVNIMFDCHNPKINDFDYNSLMNAGINIFNVDLTKHDMKYFHKVRDTLCACEKIAKTYRSSNYRPAALSIIISANDVVEVDDRVDIIILKDITETKEIFQFRKRNKKFSSMPILLWPPSNLRIEDSNELIKMSDGIVLDQSFHDGSCNIVHVLRAAKEAYKPVFHFEPNMLQDYHEDLSLAQFRRILSHCYSLIEYGVDGIIVTDCVTKSPKFTIECFVRGMDIAQDKAKPCNDFLNRSFQVLLPALAPKSAAFGASMLALKTKAKAILVLTSSGASARLLAGTCPPCHILAVTAHENTARRLHLYRQVIPVWYDKKRVVSWHQERYARVVFGTQFGLDIGLLNFAAKLVVLAPMEEGIGYCDSFYVCKVSDIVIQK